MINHPGRDLHRLRETNLGISPSELAERVGLSLNEYSDLESQENGLKDECSLWTLFLICHELAVEPVALLGLPKSKPITYSSFRTALIEEQIRSPLTIDAKLGWKTSSLLEFPGLLRSGPYRSVEFAADFLRESVAGLIEGLWVEWQKLPHTIRFENK